MANPFLLMAVLYIGLAVLAALDSALAALGILPWFNGLIWLRAHFITLGVLTEVIFGVLPFLVAASGRQSRPKTRWDIWLALNAGLVLLAAGIPLTNGTLTIAGGTLVFIAVVLLLSQILNLRPLEARKPLGGTAETRKFYIAALSYLLLGIFVGTGLYLGWDTALGMQAPREVHVHSNLWGFTSLLFAGLWIDLYPTLTSRTLAWPRSVSWIFWLMTVGELGLVIGPWIGSNLITTPGLMLHFASTLLLLANVILPLLRNRAVWSPGLLHMVLAYVWVGAPAMMAPFIIFAIPGFPVSAVETIAPPMMIYGWLLQFAFGLFPFLFSRAFLLDRKARLGGNAISLIGVNVGAALILGAALLEPYSAILSAVAYLAWVVSTLPIAYEMWLILRAGLARIEQREEMAIADNTLSLFH